VLTTDDFEKTHWHDNAIHAFRIVEGGDGCSGELILDIDFILEWLAPVENAFSFRVAPADLTFHEVTDLVVSINYASATAATQPMTIYEIRREAITYPSGHKSFKWNIEINWPPKAFISFQSVGFTQSLRMEPVTSGAQYLLATERKQ
jgi:hypothetical protein